MDLKVGQKILMKLYKWAEIREVEIREVDSKYFYLKVEKPSNDRFFLPTAEELKNGTWRGFYLNKTMYDRDEKKRTLASEIWEYVIEHGNRIKDLELEEIETISKIIFK